MTIREVAAEMGFSPKRLHRVDLERMGLAFIDRGLEREAHSIRISRTAYEEWKRRGGAA